jgi:hypothetical protein
VLRSHQEIRPFFEEGARRRPNALVRWHRTGKWLTDGERLLIWEYPRQAPDGDQVNLVEVMEIADGLIHHHRIYWGWFGTALLTSSAVGKARKEGTARRLAEATKRKPAVTVARRGALGPSCNSSRCGTIAAPSALSSAQEADELWMVHSSVRDPFAKVIMPA